MDTERYTISEMADLLGVTTHMLRHYEKVGIICPEVNPENGYRYYSVLDTRRFNLCREFLNCGISLEQCAALMGKSSREEIDRLLEESVHQQKMIIERARIAVRFMGNLWEMMPRLDERVGRVWVENIRPMWRLNFSEREKAVIPPAVKKQRSIWLKCLPAVYWTDRIRADVLRSAGEAPYEYEYGLMCYRDDALALELEKTPEVEEVVGGDYLVTVYKKTGRGPFTWDLLSAIVAYLRKEGIQTHGDAYSHILASQREGDTVINYHRLFCKIYS